VIAGGLLLAPLTVNEEAESFSKLSVNVKTNDGNLSEEKEEIFSPFEMNGIALDSIVGKYSINEKTAQITFKLGPKGGITKGAFKSFSGKVNIAQKVENSIFQVELPVVQLTTFNQYRDESLAEKGYFNTAEFPTMTFRSTKLKKEVSHYGLEGTFTMLGISKPLNVQLKYIGTSDSGGTKMPVLVGRSSIDRIQFGMKPDPKEGNIVDFEFKIELKK
jgi:polyisoprenoid-binding protein YceI